MARVRVPRDTQTDLLVTSRRRCALCFGLNQDTGIKAGQIAHVDHNPANNDIDNLVWLCLEHHDQYDSRTSQSKGLTDGELKRHRADLYFFNQRSRALLESDRPVVILSSEAARLARFLSERSINGTKFDPKERIDKLPEHLNLSEEDVAIAIDELREMGLVEQEGRNFVCPVERLFWETDPLFSDQDPVLDAQELARFLVAQDKGQIDFSVMAESLDWTHDGSIQRRCISSIATL